MDEFFNDIETYQWIGQKFPVRNECATEVVQGKNHDMVEAIKPPKDVITNRQGQGSYNGESYSNVHNNINSMGCSNEKPQRETEVNDNYLELTDPSNIDEILKLDESHIKATPHNVGILNAACQNILKQMEFILINHLKKNRKEQEIVINYLNKNERSKCYETSKKNNIRCIGIPYFKDSEGYPPPLNQDVIAKKKSNKLLPVDYINCSSVWNHRDSMQLKKAVTESSKLTTSGQFDPNSIDWMKISATNMDGKYSPAECRSMWLMYLRPEVNKSAWKRKEIRQLKVLAEENQQQDWDKIAEQLGTGRTCFQCCVKYHMFKSPSSGRWTKKEDTALLQTIKKYKIKDFIPWKKVVWNFEKRSLRQCQERYAYHLKDIKKGSFTMKEDYVLIYLYSKLKSFKEVAKYFPRRVCTQIRARYDYLVKLTMPEFSKEEDNLLTELMAKYPRNWNKISEHFENRSKVQCRSRWATLQKNISITDDSFTSASDADDNDESITDHENPENATHDDLDSVLIDKNLSQVTNLDVTPKTKKKFSEEYTKLLEYCQFGYKFLFGPKPRLPSHPEEKDKLLNNIKTVMGSLSINCLGTLPNFNIASLADNCEFNAEDLEVLELIKKSEGSDNQSVEHKILPPNYTTLVGLRTLFLGSANIRNFSSHYKPSPQPPRSNKNERILFSDAKKLFKSRLKTLFAFPLLMSEISQNGIEMKHSPVKKVKRGKPLSQRRRRIHAKRIQSFKKKIQTALDKKLVNSGCTDAVANNTEAPASNKARSNSGNEKDLAVTQPEERVTRKMGRPPIASVSNNTGNEEQLPLGQEHGDRKEGTRKRGRPRKSDARSDGSSFTENNKRRKIS
ncbi:hypothetical protein RUM44_012812 [Polyplax serrata]|uniref:snRNA-activating protein complex subunit 4 n=1 Tax=Polyplax serrata TaxID=468196 RepID=A0ABR1BEF5_POLSC